MLHCSLDEPGDASLPSNDTTIQLKLYNAPIDFWDRRFKERPIWYKISPISVFKRNLVPDVDHCDGPESYNIDDIVQDSSAIKISVLKDGLCTSRSQEPFGHLYDPDEFVFFQTKPVDAEKMSFMVEFYQENASTALSIHEHIGFSYILPSNLRGTSGPCTVAITSQSHIPIGQFSAEYLMVRPLFGVDHGTVNLASTWKPQRKGLDVGHRGAGSRRRTEKVENVLENTVASFNFAARHGADMVELDVQLSKDLIPVIYHDYYVNICMKKKRSQEEEEFLQIPIKDLSMEQLNLLKLSPVHEGMSDDSYGFSEDDHQDNQPFPTLEHILQAVDSRCGFNVEIKYPMKLIDGSWDGSRDKMCDVNEYVDIILRVLFNHAKDRSIIISCFHPDICALVALKQTRFPLLFLTQGKTEKWPAYLDPRTRDIRMACYTALSLGFTGINAHAEDLLRDRSLITFVKSRNLILFVWGDDLNDKSVIKQLKIDGVDGVVYDKVDEFASKEPLFVAPDGKKTLMNIITATRHSNSLDGSSAFSLASSSAASNTSDVSSHQTH